LDDLQAAEAGMREAVRLGLFERVAERTHELADRYDHSSELLDAWSSDDEVWMSPDLERRLRSTTDSGDVFERLVFASIAALADVPACGATLDARPPPRLL
jgi:hypothetical protein